MNILFICLDVYTCMKVYLSPSLLLKLDAILVPPRPSTAGLSYAWELANGAGGCCIGQVLTHPVLF